MMKRWSRWLKPLDGLGAAGALAVLSLGCAPHRPPIFDEAAPVLSWPAAPAEARIRYVGILSSAEDLKPARGAFQFLGDLFAGPPERRPLYGPRAAVITRSGEALWVADPGGRCMHILNLRDRSYRKISHAGADPLLSPVDICLGAGDRVYVCDSESVAIHEYSATSGAYVRTLRLPEEIARPAAVAYSAPTDELFVVDVARHDIKVLGRDDNLKRILGRRGRDAGEFNFPCDLIVDDASLWVVDTGNQRIQQLGLDGTPLAAFGSAGDAPGDLAMPKGIAIDGDGHLYVVDTRFENVQIFDRSGRLLLVFGDEGTGPGEFWLPAGVFIDAGNRIWICDSYNGRVQVFDYWGTRD